MAGFIYLPFIINAMTLKSVAIAAAKDAGRILLALSKKKIRYTLKNPHDILAEADLKAEQAIIRRIKASFPDHSILSEEKGEEDNHSDYLWIIDPLDGTINFSRQLDNYCISIAVARKGELLVGLIYEPIADKLYLAENGKGAFCNGKRIHASREEKMINMLLATDNSSTMDLRRKDYALLLAICERIRSARIFGTGALHLARLAEGHIDLYYKTKFNYWDYAAGTLLIQEAGGKVTDFDGMPITRESKNIVASNGKAHRDFLAMLRKS